MSTISAKVSGLPHMASRVFNPAGFFSHWSRELLRMYGLDPAQEAPNLEEYLALIHPQDREFMTSLIKKMVVEALGCDVTKRIVRPNGELRYIRCVGTPVVEDGTLQRIVGTAIDVTEHELLTRELRRREAYLAEAQRLSHTGSFGWKPDTGEIVWSEETYRIFECDHAVKPTIDLLVQNVHPEDRPDFLRSSRVPLRGRHGSSIPIVGCCLTGVSSTSTPWPTHYKMHAPTVSLSGRRLTLPRSNEQKRNCAKAKRTWRKRRG